MSTALESKLRNRLSVGEKIRLDQFMYAALLDVECGYYNIHRVFGKDGDFITAPDISQIFGEVVAAYIAAHVPQYKDQDVAVVELGPGRATMAKDMLRAMQKMPDENQPDEVIMCEISEPMVVRQREKLDGITMNMQWIQHVTDLPERPCFIIANEFFDALPIRQFMYEDDWQERFVGLKEEAFVFTSEPCDFPNASLTTQLPDPQRGDILEYSASAMDAMQTISTHLAQYGGMMIAIDYGYMEQAYGDSLQAVKSHEYIDVLTDIGEADISAHVNFAQLKEVAEAHGLKTHILTTQGQFLRALGAELRAAKLCKKASDEQKETILSGLHRIMAPDQMGDLFKVLVVASEGMEVEDIGL